MALSFNRDQISQNHVERAFAATSRGEMRERKPVLQSSHSADFNDYDEDVNLEVG